MIGKRAIRCHSRDEAGRLLLPAVLAMAAGLRGKTSLRGAGVEAESALPRDGPHGAARRAPLPGGRRLSPGRDRRRRQHRPGRPPVRRRGAGRARSHRRSPRARLGPFFAPVAANAAPGDQLLVVYGAAQAGGHRARGAAVWRSTCRRPPTPARPAPAARPPGRGDHRRRGPGDLAASPGRDGRQSQRQAGRLRLGLPAIAPPRPGRAARGRRRAEPAARGPLAGRRRLGLPRHHAPAAPTWASAGWGAPRAGAAHLAPRRLAGRRQHHLPLDVEVATREMGCPAVAPDRQGLHHRLAEQRRHLLQQPRHHPRRRCCWSPTS